MEKNYDAITLFPLYFKNVWGSHFADIIKIVTITIVTIVTIIYENNPQEKLEELEIMYPN